MTYTKSKKSEFLIASGLAVSSVVIGVSPSYASVANVSSTVGSLSTVSAGITTIVLGAMGVRMAIKLVNRVAVKG